MIDYQEILPSAKLKHLIVHFWTLNNPKGPYKHMNFPMTTPYLYLQLNESRYRITSSKSQLISDPCEFKWGEFPQEEISFDKGYQCVGIRFQPGAWTIFNQKNHHKNPHQNFEDILQWSNDLRPRLSELSLKDAIELLQSEILNIKNRNDFQAPSSILLDLQNLMDQQSFFLKIADMAQYLGKSIRQLERDCRRLSGLTPSKFQSLYRTQRALSKLWTCQRSNLWEIASQFGFYDTAHFYKNVKYWTEYGSREINAFIKKQSSELKNSPSKILVQNGIRL